MKYEVALEGSTQQYTVQVVLQEKEGGPPVAVYGMSDSGWKDGAKFLSWFTKLFLPAVSYLARRTSFRPQQCKGGFRGAGLILFSC